jgi:hypothetical protein
VSVEELEAEYFGADEAPAELEEGQMAEGEGGAEDASGP